MKWRKMLNLFRRAAVFLVIGELGEIHMRQTDFIGIAGPDKGLQYEIRGSRNIRSPVQSFGRNPGEGSSDPTCLL